jgi:enoyl-CoA hydratase
LDYSQVTYQPGKVARIELSRAKYRNAQSRVLLEELDDAFTRAAADNEVRVIVLSGKGDHFSSGHDLGTPEELADREKRGYPANAKTLFDQFKEVFFDKTLRWRNLPKPTIAMVRGYCIFGGWMIASAMDVIFAAEDALFLPTLFQYFSVPWDIGPRKAKEILFEHRFITAREAYDLHFVNRVYSSEHLEKQTLAYAERVAENHPFVLRLTKHSVNHMMDTMGFTGELEAAFQSYFIKRYREWKEGERPSGRETAATQRAMTNLELTMTDWPDAPARKKSK